LESCLVDRQELNFKKIPTYLPTPPTYLAIGRGTPSYLNIGCVDEVAGALSNMSFEQKQCRSAAGALNVRSLEQHLLEEGKRAWLINYAYVNYVLFQLLIKSVCVCVCVCVHMSAFLCFSNQQPATSQNIFVVFQLAASS